MKSAANKRYVGRRNPEIKGGVGLLVLFVFSCQLNLRAVEAGPVNIHGTISQGYLNSSRNNYISGSQNGTFAFREYGLNAVYAKDKWTIGGQVFGREFGTVGNDRIYLDWLTVDYAWHDWMGLRAGKLKVPYGFYGATRDIESLRTEILLPQGVYLEYIRATFDSAWGAELHGYIPGEKYGGLSYQLQCGVRDMNEKTREMERLFSRRGSTVDDIREGDSVAGALTWHTPIEGLRLGTTLSWCEFKVDGIENLTPGPGITPYTSSVKDFRMGVVSAEYMKGPLTLVSEAMMQTYRSAYTYDLSPAGMKYDAKNRGLYLRGDYYVLDNLALGGGMSWFRFDSKTNTGAGRVRKSNSYSDDLFFSLRWDITENLIFKAEQHFISGPAGAFISENPGGVNDDWSMTLFKLSYVF